MTLLIQHIPIEVFHIINIYNSFISFVSSYQFLIFNDNNNFNNFNNFNKTDYKLKYNLSYEIENFKKNQNLLRNIYNYEF